MKKWLLHFLQQPLSMVQLRGKLKQYANETKDEVMSMAVDCPAGHLRWINAAAVEMDIDFSQVLQEALLAKVQVQ